MSDQSTQRIAALKTAAKEATAGFMPSPAAIKSFVNLAVETIEAQQAQIDTMRKAWGHANLPAGA